MTTLIQRSILIWVGPLIDKLRDGLSFLHRDIIWWLLKIFLGIPLRLFFRIRSEGKKHFPPKGQAALVIGNHPNILDPVIISSFIERPICFVVADHSGRNGFTGRFLDAIKVIPKTKNMPDSATMRLLLRAARQNQIIGIAPEGGRNWDGVTTSLNHTIPRLVRKLRIPVVCIRQKGAYLSWPRWASWPRRGRIVLQFSYLFEDTSSIPEDEVQISAMIEEKLNYNELEDQEITRHSFRRYKAAERLELRLWLCPHCHRFFTLRSHGNHLFCRSCRATWEFAANGKFTLQKTGDRLDSQARNFKTYIEWARYNDNQTVPRLKRTIDRKSEGILSLPAKMWAKSEGGDLAWSFAYQGKGMVKLTDDFRMVFLRSHDRKLLLDSPLTHLKGTHVIWNHKLEFFLSGQVYRLTFYGNSAYFWHFLVKAVQDDEGIINN